MMKRLLAILLSLLLLTACGARGGEEAPVSSDTRPLRVVTTIFPEYDWVRQILGTRADEVQLTLLLDKGVDLHSYQPTVDDMVKIADCDLFLYVGGESDDWVDDALEEARNPNLRVLNLLEALGDEAKEEELVEGMQEEEEEEEDEVEEEGPEYDEHVWLSLRNAEFYCGLICQELSALDPAHADEYEANLADYRAKLQALDAEYQRAVSAAPYDTLLFGDRFPFRYLTDDYGLAYFAAFVGCSAETEASFETVVFLSGKLEELGLPAVLTIENSDGKIAQTIVENSQSRSARILTLDSLQSTTAQDAQAGADYLGTMEENLAVLRQALGM